MNVHSPSPSRCNCQAFAVANGDIAAQRRCSGRCPDLCSSDDAETGRHMSQDFAQRRVFCRQSCQGGRARQLVTHFSKASSRNRTTECQPTSRRSFSTAESRVRISSSAARLFLLGSERLLKNDGGDNLTFQICPNFSAVPSRNLATFAGTMLGHVPLHDF